MSPFSSKAYFPPFALLFSLILGNCTTTYEFQNYHRSAVKTPAQYYPISQVDIPSTPHKGD